MRKIIISITTVLAVILMGVSGAEGYLYYISSFLIGIIARMNWDEKS